MGTGWRVRHLVVGALALVWVAFVSVPSAQAQASDPVGEWRAFGADPTNTKYSPLDQITANNFTDLEIAWRWTSISTEVTSRRPDIRPAQFKTTPLMVGGLVYASTALGQVATVDAGTGRAGLVVRPSNLRPARPAGKHGLATSWSVLLGR